MLHKIFQFAAIFFVVHFVDLVASAPPKNISHFDYIINLPRVNGRYRIALQVLYPLDMQNNRVNYTLCTLGNYNSSALNCEPYTNNTLCE